MHRDTYESVGDLADVAVRNQHNRPLHKSADWYGGVGSYAEAVDLARYGWQDVQAEAERVAESAIATVEQDHDIFAVRPFHDVAGSDVDVSAFLAGVPESMVEYEIVQSPRHGRIITLCASVGASEGVSGESYKRRGHGIAALALALSRIGYNVELWADLTTEEGGTQASIRTLVKGANDVIDPSRIMFGFAHPAMLRVLCIAAMHAFPSSVRKAIGIPGGYGAPADPVEDLPEGTIYLPSVSSNRDIPDADVMLRDQLVALGLITL